MRRPYSRLRAVALLVPAAAWACGGGAIIEVPGTPTPQAPPPAQPAQTSVPAPYPAAVEFVTGMIHHHAQAIHMAEMAASHDASATIRSMSQRIIISQTDEIALMQMWLRDNGQPVPEPDHRGMLMTMGGMEHHMLMPGMLTEEQLAQLDQARGEEFDRLMLTLMIQHHQGALEMVDTLFNSYGGTADDMIYKLASDIYADQDAEIDRMYRMLEGMSPAGEAR